MQKAVVVETNQIKPDYNRSMTREELLAAWQEGLGKRIVNYANTMRLEGEDAAQEVISNMLRAYPDGPDKSASGLAHTAVRNMAITESRRRKIRPTEVDIDCLPEEMIAHNETPERVAIERENHLELMSAIEELTPDQKVAVRGRLDGFSHVEIGEELGIDENAVKGRFTRAKRSLARRLSGTGIRENPFY